MACINVLGGGRFTKFKGSFGPQKAIAQIRLEYADGAVEFIGTDESWRVAAGPITFSSIYGGEDFDARLVQNGWNQINFDDSKWQPAKVVDGPGGELRGLSCAAPPMNFFEIHQPSPSRTLTNGDVVFDLGQNAAHVPKISVTGPAGSQVRFFPSELINTDGAVNQGSMGAGIAARFGANSPRPPTAWKRGRRNFSTSAAVMCRRISRRPRPTARCQKSNRLQASWFIPPPSRSANLNAPMICSTASARSSAGRSATTWSV